MKDVKTVMEMIEDSEKLMKLNGQIVEGKTDELNVPKYKIALKGDAKKTYFGQRINYFYDKNIIQLYDTTPTREMIIIIEVEQIEAVTVLSDNIRLKMGSTNSKLEALQGVSSLLGAIGGKRGE